jgi:imidazolonepropionase
MFAGDRADEFAARMAGETYTAGGIRRTVSLTRAASAEQLRAHCAQLVDEMTRSGITHLEIKSGYGLTVEDEIRALRIAREFTDDVTLLGAHVVPAEFAENRASYVELVVDEMLPAARGIAKWVDVFCDRGAFSIDETRKIFSAANGFGLRLHGNQLERGETVSLVREFDIASIDHCTHMLDADLELLASSTTVATLLPGAEFSTRSPYPDARRFYEAGVKVAIATDCNPGSSYTTSMPFCIAVAVRDMHFTVDQALHAATAGGAAALRRADVGNLSVGASADFVVLDAPTYAHLAYRPGVNLIHQTWRNGARISPKDQSWL